MSMHLNLRSRLAATIVLIWLKGYDAGSPIDFSHNHDNEHQHSKILQFPNEQILMDTFGENEQIIQLFNNRTISKPDPTVPGDMGFGFSIENPTEEIEFAINEGYKTYAFNKYISDLIPLQRRLRDHRNERCFTPDRILKNLLPTSVIMCFYNEALSMLLRSVHSIINRTPPHLLSEIILIDDFSEHDELKEELEFHLNALPKVKLVRLPQREGLIRARLIGADLAVAPVLTFLDSHVETSVGWLEPLLDRVTRSWTTIAIPYLDHIDRNTLSYNATSDDRIVGGFTWDLMFSWKAPTEENMKDAHSLADPFTSPTMPGGLFSIHRDFFEYLSKYDDQLEVWGAENLELSFKAWLCGGRIEIVPCSRVAHLERGSSPYQRDEYKRNVARVAAVWLDEYVDIFYAQNSEATRDYGDISSRLAVKKKMNCFSFDWYMNNVVPDMFNPKHAVASGEVKNLDYGEVYCLDAHLGPNLTVSTPSLFFNCHGLGGNQHWYYSSTGEIRKGKKCLDYFGQHVTLLECHGLQGNQNWEYHADTGVIVHTNTDRCLTLDGILSKVVVVECQGELYQRWKFENDRFHEIFKDFDFQRRMQELYE